MNYQYSIINGHYDEINNGKFYCSELAYWIWEQISKQEGIDFGIVRQETMFPPIGIDDPDNCSILPAYLFERSMEVKKE